MGNITKLARKDNKCVENVAKKSQKNKRHKTLKKKGRRIIPTSLIISMIQLFKAFIIVQGPMKLEEKLPSKHLP